MMLDYLTFEWVVEAGYGFLLKHFSDVDFDTVLLYDDVEMIEYSAKVFGNKKKRIIKQIIIMIFSVGLGVRL